MTLSRVSAGKNLPDEFHVIVEIPMNSDPVKLEVDKETDAIFVDRFMSTAMRYPCNYGYIPQTLAADGDPVDALVIAPFPLQPGVVIRCRAVGLLRMEDENGEDNKVIAVPVEKLTLLYSDVREPEHLQQSLRQQIAHFFTHYKDLEPEKYVRVGGYGSSSSAVEEIIRGVAAYQMRAHTGPG